MMINQVFQDVLKDYDTRTLYDQLCQFRQVYIQSLHLPCSLPFLFPSLPTYLPSSLPLPFPLISSLPLSSLSLSLPPFPSLSSAFSKVQTSKPPPLTIMHNLNANKTEIISFVLLLQHYGRVPYQRQRGLQVAQSKLESLHKQLKKNRAPLSLLSEIQNALDLINLCQHRHKH